MNGRICAGPTMKTFKQITSLKHSLHLDCAPRFHNVQQCNNDLLKSKCLPPGSFWNIGTKTTLANSSHRTSNKEASSSLTCKFECTQYYQQLLHTYIISILWGNKNLVLSHIYDLGTYNSKMLNRCLSQHSTTGTSCTGRGTMHTAALRETRPHRNFKKWRRLPKLHQFFIYLMWVLQIMWM